MIPRKLRMGMVGGGIGAFIGAVHRMGASLDGQIELSCGAFSSNAEKSQASGAELFLPPERVYKSFAEMIEQESRLPDTERMDFVSIVTPNHMHHDPAVAALKAGFPVIIDKPLAFSYQEALQLRQQVAKTQLPFAVTYTYTGYPMVKQARAMVKEGKIGDVRKVMVEYPQGWLATKLEDTNQKQASWRSDPMQAGISNCFGDIGTHAANMAEYVSGLAITDVLSMLTAFVPGRVLDDDANVFIKLGPDANGVLSASQVATGEENDLKLRVYGSKGGLEWTNRDPNTLIFRPEGLPAQILRSGGNMSYLHEAALMHMRTPAGHPEGYIEAFANIYRNFAIDVRRHLGSEEKHNAWMDYPGIEDGVKGMALVQAVVSSSKEGNVWKPVEMS